MRWSIIYDLYTSGLRSSSAIFLRGFSTSEHRIPLRQLRIDMSRSLAREGWQCDIPHVSNPTVRSVTRTSMYARSFVVLTSWIETDKRKPGRCYERTPSRETRREKEMEYIWTRGRRGRRRRENGEWNADASRYSSRWMVFFFEKFPSGNTAKIILGKEQEWFKYRFAICSTDKFDNPINPEGLSNLAQRWSVARPLARLIFLFFFQECQDENDEDYFL